MYIHIFLFFHCTQIERKRFSISLLCVGLCRKCLWTIQKKRNKVPVDVLCILAFVLIVKVHFQINKTPMIIDLMCIQFEFWYKAS